MRTGQFVTLQEMPFRSLRIQTDKTIEFLALEVQRGLRIGGRNFLREDSLKEGS